MKNRIINIVLSQLLRKYFACFAVNKDLRLLLIRNVFILFLLFIPKFIFCQEGKLSEIIISIAEELAADDSDPEASPLYLERLQELTENPVRLNSADETELSRLFFLSDFQIKALADYIHSSGKIISLFEIVNIPGFEREITEMMIPFITLNSRPISVPDSSVWRNTLLTNISVKTSDTETSTIGSSWKILTKYKFTAGALSGGVTTEKDNGEKFFSGNPPRPDFLSAHFAYSGTGILRKIIIGDYSARFGQGTNINTGIRTGLSLTSSGYLSGRDEIKPYTSTEENNFFRGTAAQFQLKNFGFSLFYSVNEIDATLGSTNGLSNDYIATFYRTGLHDTPSAVIKKDVVTEIGYGADLSCNFNNLRVGMIWCENRFSLPVKTASLKPEDIYDFDGELNTITTAYYNAIYRKLIFFGEVSVNYNKKYALIQGLSFRPADRLNINLLYRNYEPGFISFHGKNPFSSSGGGNLNGLLGNFTFEAARFLFISAGCDLRYYPWLKYRCSAPSMSNSREIRVKYLPTEKITLEASYNYRYLMLNGQENNGIIKQEETVSRTIKGTLRYSPYERLTIGSRIDYRIITPSGSKGMLLLQDINYRFRTVPVSFWFRYCIFRTSDWDSRLYTYENDMVYSFSIPVLSGEGSRSYIMAGWKISELADIRVKYAFTSLVKNSEVCKETREFRMQIRLWF